MSRFAIFTVGLIHTGKTTFANHLLEEIPNLVKLERDDVGLFIAHNLSALKISQLKHHNNTFPVKDQVYEALVSAAVESPELHLIFSHCHTYKEYRHNQIEKLRSNVPGVHIIMVHFDLPIQTIQKRVVNSTRDTAVLTVSKSFEENFNTQKNKFQPPTEDEADTFFTIKKPEDAKRIASEIKDLIKSCKG